MYRREDYERAIELIAAGQIKTDPLISRHFTLDEYAAAYDLIDKLGKDVMKVFIDL